MEPPVMDSPGVSKPMSQLSVALPIQAPREPLGVLAMSPALQRKRSSAALTSPRVAPSSVAAMFSPREQRNEDDVVPSHDAPAFQPDVCEGVKKARTMAPVLQPVFMPAMADGVTLSAQEPLSPGPCEVHECVLPILGREEAEHPDLHCISVETVRPTCHASVSLFPLIISLPLVPPVPLQLRRVLDGDFSDRVGRVLILDCRYPFEFEGGHIRGALNAHDPLVVAEVRRQQEPVGKGNASGMLTSRRARLAHAAAV